MRNLLIAVAASAALLVSSAAHALDINLQLTDNFGFSDATIDLAEQTVTGTTGQIFELTITVDNSAGDDLASIFSFITQSNPNGTSLFNAGPSPILTTITGTPPFTSEISLNPLGGDFGTPATGQPAGTLVGLAHTAGGERTSATGPDVGLVLLMAIADEGQNNIGQALLSANGASTVNLTGGVVVNIPEPGTALLMGLGLAGLATAGRRED